MASQPRVEWATLAEEVLTGIEGWRAEHPRASWQEIEAVVEERLARLRGQVLQDVAQASPAAGFRGAAERPLCPASGAPLQAAGQKRGRLTTNREQALVVERIHGRCPACGTEVFLLDEEPGRLPGEVAPPCTTRG